MMPLTGTLTIDVGSLVGVFIAVFGMIAAGALAIRRGKTAAQDETIANAHAATEAWEARYRAQQEEIHAQGRQIADLKAQVEAGRNERDQLKAEIATLRARPIELDSLVQTVKELAGTMRSVIENEGAIRQHAHDLKSIGGAANLKLDALLQHAGIPSS